jgi:dUTP pyrophosphatase
MKLLVKKLTDTAKLPNKDRPEDEGWDIFADENIVLNAGGVTKVSTGIACAVEDEYVQVGECYRDNNGDTQQDSAYQKYWIQIEGRSGMASKGVFPVGGIVDNGYSGEIGVMLCNLTGTGFTITKGDKIAQLVIRKHYDPELTEVQSLEETDRGEKGFGSSGK